MKSAISPQRTRHLTLLLFFFAAFNFIYSKHFIYDGNPPNRVSLCLALLENRSVVIDKYYHLTADHCIRDGHYYSDKAPGASFLAMPFIAAAFYGLQAMGRTDVTSIDPRDGEPNVNFKLLMLAGSLAVSIPCALAVAVFFRLCLGLGLAPFLSFFGSVLLGFGTPFGIWATFFIGHSLAGAFLVFSLTGGLFFLAEKRPAGWGWGGVGFLLAYAVWIEYTAAVPACLLGTVFLGIAGRRGRKALELLRIATGMFLGAVPVVCGFFLYNTIAFGSPFCVGYQFVTMNFPLMQQGFCGVNVPQPSVFFRTLFDPRFGILWFSPIFAFSPLFAVGGIVLARHRLLNVFCLVIPIYYFLLNASYAYWWQSDIPVRHTTASFPFLLLPVLLLWNDLGVRSRRAVGFFALLGLFLCSIALYVPCMPSYYDWPFSSPALVKDFVLGKMKNLLYYAGVDPRLSFLPIIAAWVVFVYLARRWLFGHPRADVPGS